MRNIKRLSVTLLLGGVVLGTAAASDTDNVLAVHASGFDNSNGHAIAKLFSYEDNVLGRGRQEFTAQIRDGQADFRIGSLAPGAYALVVFHDENGNGEIDHNVLRLPREALGFSNHFSPGPLAGMPSFAKLRFEHATGYQRLDITVKRLW